MLIFILNIHVFGCRHGTEEASYTRLMDVDLFGYKIRLHQGRTVFVSSYLICSINSIIFILYFKVCQVGAVCILNKF